MIIGIDGGGTKTEGVLVDLKGNVRKYFITSGSNPNSQGISQAVEAILETINYLKGTDTLEGICLSIAGAAMESIQKNIIALITPHIDSTTKILMGSDALGCMSSGIQNADGVVIIAGTGSAAFARKKGEYFRVGGWGHLIDDAGSGYDMGRLALRAVLRAWDGREKATSLTQLFIEKMGGTPPWENLGEIYEGGKAFVATFAPLVLQAKEDEVAKTIVQRSIEDLGKMVVAASSHLEKKEIIPVVLTGSLWKSETIYQGVKQFLGEKYQLIMPEVSPVYGAVVEAALEVGWTVDEKFQQNFQVTYKKIN